MGATFLNAETMLHEKVSDTHARYYSTNYPKGYKDCEFASDDYLRLVDEAIKYHIVNTHISNIRAGDTVEHEGRLLTVHSKSLKKGDFWGDTLFGDSYRMGTAPVRKAIIYHAKPQKG